MTRLRRILLNAATVLSLVLCVATVVLWSGGTRMVVSTHPVSRDENYVYHVAYGLLDGRFVLGRYFRGFQGRAATGYVRDTSIHCGWIFLATALLPSLVVARRLRQQPVNATLCPTCGYDLRATPARCPECGAAPPPPPPAAAAPPAEPARPGGAGG